MEDEGGVMGWRMKGGVMGWDGKVIRDCPVLK